MLVVRDASFDCNIEGPVGGPDKGRTSSETVGLHPANPAKYTAEVKSTEVKSNEIKSKEVKSKEVKSSKKWKTVTNILDKDQSYYLNNFLASSRSG